MPGPAFKQAPKKHAKSRRPRRQKAEGLHQPAWPAPAPKPEALIVEIIGLGAVFCDVHCNAAGPKPEALIVEIIGLGAVFCDVHCNAAGPKPEALIVVIIGLGMGAVFCDVHCNGAVFYLLLLSRFAEMKPRTVKEAGPNPNLFPQKEEADRPNISHYLP